MNEPVVAPVRSRVPSTAGPWHLVGRFDTGGGGDIEPGMVTGPSDIDGITKWLTRFDERRSEPEAAGRSGPAAFRRLTLAGRVLVPAAPSAATVWTAVAPGSWNRAFLLAAMEQGGESDVVEGSFDLNGVTVPVSAFDSPSDLVERINRSGAGALAHRERPTDRLVLTSTRRGRDSNLELGSDTSGVLATLGLDPASVQPGREAGFERTLVGLFPGRRLAAGPLVVNDRPVTVDPDRDEFAPLLHRISHTTDALLEFDATARRVVLSVSLTPGSIEIDDTTGLLEALGLQAGVYTAAGSRADGVPALVIRSWLGPEDRVTTRAIEPTDLYRADRALVGAAPSRAASRVLADHMAGSPSAQACSKGSAAEEIAVARQLLHRT